jgi:hypothetical protein
MRKLFMCCLAILLLSVAGPLIAQSDAFLGTWKLNVQKSKFQASPPSKSETRVVTTGPMGMHVSVDRVDAEGNAQQFEYTTNLDGKNYPIVGQGPYGADSIAANLTSPNTIQSTLKNGGKVVATANTVVSSDGKVVTITTKGVDAGGKHFLEVRVYEKQ